MTVLETMFSCDSSNKELSEKSCFCCSYLNIVMLSIINDHIGAEEVKIKISGRRIDMLVHILAETVKCDDEIPVVNIIFRLLTHEIDGSGGAR